MFKKGLFLVLFAALTACSEDADGPESVFVPDVESDTSTSLDAGADGDLQPDVSPDSAEEDSGDTGTDTDLTCPTVPCASGRVCVDGVCQLDTSCGLTHDLGTLAAGSSLSHEGSFVTEGRDNLTTSCAGATAGLERVVSFTVTERSQVDVVVDWDGQFDGVVALQTDCASNATELACQDNEVLSQILEAGTYYLVLEMKFGNAGNYSVQVSAQPASCVPGENTCAGDDVLSCVDGMPETLACPAGCSAGACEGGSCATAISVTAPGGVFEGDAGALVGSLDFAANSSCGSVATPGFETVFYLPGLTTGQIVTINAATGDNNVNAIFVTSACGAAETCVAQYSVEDVDWVVPADGDYYVVIDKLLNARSAFRYEISIF